MIGTNQLKEFEMTKITFALAVSLLPFSLTGCNPFTESRNTSSTETPLLVRPSTNITRAVSSLFSVFTYSLCPMSSKSFSFVDPTFSSIRSSPTHAHLMDLIVLSVLIYVMQLLSIINMTLICLIATIMVMMMEVY